MKLDNLTETRKYITDLVLQAGEILRGYFTSGNFIFKSKGGVDFLTQADEEVDAFLRENIAKKYPKMNFLTEETAPKDYSHLKNTENLWVIDPLDGTVNFSRDNPHFAISVALVNKGVPILGVVYLPVENLLFWAQEDQKEAYLNGSPIKASPTDDLTETVLVCDWGWILKKRLIVVSWLGKISTQVRQIKSMGSAVADLASLAAGKIDIYIHSDLKPWDVAASTLFIEKAGGRITTPAGKKWNVFNTEMLASNGLLHEKILALVNK